MMPHETATSAAAASETGGRGLFVVIEGLDGAGTTTQSQRLSRYLREQGRRVERTAEPTTGPVGAVIRQAIERRITLEPRALAAAFAADRLDHYHNGANGIRKHLETGIDVVSDRYVLSSLAYQALDCDLKWLLALNSEAPPPDLNVYLEVDPEVAWQRIGARSATDELFHVPEKLRRIADNYRRALELPHPLTQALVVDGNRPPDEVFAQIRAAVEDLRASVGR